MVVRWVGGQIVAPEIEVRRRHPVGAGQANPLIRRGEAGVVAGLLEGLGHHVGIERTGVGETLPVGGDDPDADPGRLGRRKRLHLALVDADLGLAAATHVGLHLLAVPGPAGDPGGQLQQAGVAPQSS